MSPIWPCITSLLWMWLWARCMNQWHIQVMDGRFCVSPLHHHTDTHRHIIIWWFTTHMHAAHIQHLTLCDCHHLLIKQTITIGRELLLTIQLHSISHTYPLVTTPDWLKVHWAPCPPPTHTKCTYFIHLQNIIVSY